MAAPRRMVALIRGINVGKAKRVAMADLRELMTELGYQDVRTLLNSGNVVFTTSPTERGDAASRIERALLRRTGVSARVMVLRAAELAEIVACDPFGPGVPDHSRLLVFVLASPSDRARLVPLTREAWEPEGLVLGRRAAFAWCPQGIIESRLAGALGRILGDAVTVRNWATLNKLHAASSG